MCWEWADSRNSQCHPFWVRTPQRPVSLAPIQAWKFLSTPSKLLPMTVTRLDRKEARFSQINFSSAIVIIVFWAMPGHQVGGGSCGLSSQYISSCPCFCCVCITYWSSSPEIPKTHLKHSHLSPHVINHHSRAITFLAVSVHVCSHCHSLTPKYGFGLSTLPPLPSENSSS